MATATIEQSDGLRGSSASRSEEEICHALRSSLRGCTSVEDAYRSALRAIARHFDAPYARLRLDISSGTIEDRAGHAAGEANAWSGLCEGLLLSACCHNRAVARLYEAAGAAERFAALAVPLGPGQGEDPFGSMVVVTRCADHRIGEARLGELKALVSIVEVIASNPPSSPPGHGQAYEGIVRGATFHSLHEFAFALSNDLKSTTGCDQVCLGLVRGQRVTMLCMSGLDNLYPRSPGAKLIVQAMEECLDAGKTLCCRNTKRGDSADGSTGHPLHRQWHHATGNASVASIPLSAGGQCLAILSLRQAADKPFPREMLKKTSALVEPLVPALLFMERANRRLVSHGWDALVGTTKSWLHRGAWGRKLLAVALVGLALWMTMGAKPYVVSVPCRVVPAETHRLAAPLEAPIRAVHVQPGDHVVTGQLLVEFDAEELAMRRDKLRAELNIADLQLARAALGKDVSAAALARSQAEMARTELESVNYRIARATVRASEDGIVLTGDLSSRIGEVVPLGEPLLDLVPAGRWSLELRAPEYVAAYLAAGQAGKFTTEARPDQTQACRLVRPHPCSQIVDGKNVFTAEADLRGAPPVWIRAGMQGIARIDVGRRPVWWVQFHRLIDGIRLRMWKL